MTYVIAEPTVRYRWAPRFTRRFKSLNEVGLGDFWASCRSSPMTYHQLPQSGLVTPMACVVSGCGRTTGNPEVIPR
jgi:hypothetical protein